LVLEFVNKADLVPGEGLGKVWFEAATKGVPSMLYVSTDADIAPEFAVELTGVKVFTADDLIL
ncbi:MAG: hypothetical protein PHN45_09770, partial [Methylococcales bacterium]|nr:hypothetical protein [Methylococcales bacterium]